MTFHHFLMQSALPPGPVYVLATTSLQASAAVRLPPRETSGCAEFSSNAPKLSHCRATVHFAVDF